MQQNTLFPKGQEAKLCWNINLITWAAWRSWRPVPAAGWKAPDAERRACRGGVGGREAEGHLLGARATALPARRLPGA